MAPDRPLAYPCWKCILQNMEYNLRQTLIRKCPAILTADKTVPVFIVGLHARKMSTREITFNDIVYKLDVIQLANTNPNPAKKPKVDGPIETNLALYQLTMYSTIGRCIPRLEFIKQTKSIDDAWNYLLIKFMENKKLSIKNFRYEDNMEGYMTFMMIFLPKNIRFDSLHLDQPSVEAPPEYKFPTRKLIINALFSVSWYHAHQRIHIVRVLHAHSIIKVCQQLNFPNGVHFSSTIKDNQTGGYSYFSRMPNARIEPNEKMRDTEYPDRITCPKNDTQEISVWMEPEDFRKFKFHAAIVQRQLD